MHPSRALVFVRRHLALVLLLVLPGFLPPGRAATSPPHSVVSESAARWSFSGLAGEDISALAVNPANPQVAFAAVSGSSGWGIYRTIDGGREWEEVYGGFPHHALAINPANPNIVYAGEAYEVLKSVDGGTGWVEIGSIGASTHSAFVVDPASPNTVYGGVRDGWGVYKTVDGGANWTNLLTSRAVFALALDPVRRQILFAGTADYYEQRGGVLRSADGGVNWTQVTTNTRVNALAVNPVDPAIVYAGTEGEGVLKSTDGGVSWSAANNGLTHLIVRSLVVNPIDPKLLYAGTWEGGVFHSGDGGASWSPINTGLTNTFILSLALDPVNPNLLYAGTQGGGVFKVELLPLDPSLGTTYAKVIDQSGNPIAGAQVYRNGGLVVDPAGAPQLTNAAGNLILNGAQQNDTLVALLPRYQRSTVRRNHDGWAYQVALTSLVIGGDGSVEPFRIAEPGGPQRLVVAPERALVLFNLLVSVEWDATPAYLDDLTQAIDRAADFLYDATDGQMTFDQVAIYDRAEHWADADIQISAKNVVQPHANVGGLTDDDPSHVIRVGRFWDGHSGSQGAWSLPNGFRTLVHEFGHYGLGLYDEYFGYNIVGGELAGQRLAFCTGPENRAGVAGVASIMDYHYTTRELADAGRWTTHCQRTAQHQLNGGEADWQTLARLYRDGSGASRWRLVTPDQRAGNGQPVIGPATVPTAIPFPDVTVHNTGTSLEAFELAVCEGNARYGAGAWVTLYMQDGKAIDQGLTDASGRLTILGARPGDTLRVISLDSTLIGQQQVPYNGCLNLRPQVLMAAGASAGPYLRLWPTVSNNQLDGLRLVMSGTQPSDTLTYVLTGPDRIGPSAAIPYDAGAQEHRVQVSFVPPALAGHAKVLGAHSGQFVDINIDYRIQPATNISDTTLFSNDGNLALRLAAGSLPLNKVPFLIASPWGLPGAAPDGLEIVGEAYEISAASGVIALGQPAVLRLHYDAAAGLAFERLNIYRWDFSAGRWLLLGGEREPKHQEIVAVVDDLGLYALMGAPGNLYLPLTLR